MGLARLPWLRYALVVLAGAAAVGLVGGILWGGWWFGVPLAFAIFVAMLYGGSGIRFAFGADRQPKPKA